MTKEKTRALQMLSNLDNEETSADSRTTLKRRSCGAPADKPDAARLPSFQKAGVMEAQKIARASKKGEFQRISAFLPSSQSDPFTANN